MGAMVTIFDPQGNPGEVPQSQLAAAVKAGAMPAVHIQSPDGKDGYIPANRTHDAIQNGAKLLPFQQQEVKHPGFWHELSADVTGIARGAASLPSVIANPASALTAGAQAGIDDMMRQQEGRGLTYRVAAPVAQNLTGTNVRGMEESANQGDVGGVLGHAAAVPTVMAAGELAGAGARALPKASIRPAAASLLRGASDIVDPELTGVVSPRIAHAQRLAARFADALAKKPAEFTNPGAPLPEAPAAELLQANALLHGAQPVVDPAAGLGRIPVNQQAPIAQPVAQLPVEDFIARIKQQEAARAAKYGKGVQSTEKPEMLSPSEIALFQEGAFGEKPPADIGNKVRAANPEPTRAEVKAAELAKNSKQSVQDALDQALGNKKPVAGVALKDQPAAQALAQNGLPQGFTPVESSAVKGYKYSPETREFETITKSGQHYIHGDVSPEEAAAFEQAESKGKAWMQVRNNPLVAKVLNGKRVAVKPSVPAMDDLTQILQDSLAQVKRRQ